MLRKCSLIAGALLGFGLPTASPAQTVFNVTFREPQYVYMCHSMDDMSWIVDGAVISHDEVKRRRDAKRVPATRGSLPPCDYIKVSGNYALFRAYNGLERLSDVPVFGNVEAQLNLGIYRTYDLVGNPMHMLLGIATTMTDQAVVEFLTYLYGIE